MLKRLSFLSWVLVVALSMVTIPYSPKVAHAEEISWWAVGLLGGLAIGASWLNGERVKSERRERVETIHRNFKLANEASLSNLFGNNWVYNPQTRKNEAPRVCIETGSFPIDADAIRGLTYSLVQRSGGQVSEGEYDLKLKIYWWQTYGEGQQGGSGGSHTYSGNQNGSSFSSSSDSHVEEIEGAVAVEVWKNGVLILGPAVAMSRSSEVLSSSHSYNDSNYRYTKSGQSYSNSHYSGYQNWTDAQWMHYHLIEKCIAQFN